MNHPLDALREACGNTGVPLADGPKLLPPDHVLPDWQWKFLFHPDSYREFEDDYVCINRVARLMDTDPPAPLRQDRLKEVIRVLANVPAEEFNLDVWSCGTSACAIGWCGVDPWFNREGLRIAGGAPHYMHGSSWSAVQEFFGMSFPLAQYLFSPDSYSYSHSPGMVSARIKEVLGEQAG